MFKNKLAKAVEIEQLRLLSEIEGADPSTEEYKLKIQQIKTLDEVKSKKDWTQIIVALIGAGATLFSIGFILKYEETGAIISKSFGLVPKTRI